VFSLAGMLLVAVAHRARVESSVLAGFLILFVAFEIGFYGLTALLSQQELLGELAWYQIGIGNLLAAAAMGTYLWRRHPELSSEFAHALGGAE
jgi:divalent metal cation (Fe/Co/Zn/Cd) transporter